MKLSTTLKAGIAAVALVAGAASQPVPANSMFDHGLQDRTALGVLLILLGLLLMIATIGFIPDVVLIFFGILSPAVAVGGMRRRQ